MHKALIVPVHDQNEAEVVTKTKSIISFGKVMCPEI